MPSYAVVQYPIVLMVLVYSLFTLYDFRVKKSNFYILILLLFFSGISYFYGYISELVISTRAFIVPIIFLIILNSRSYKLLHVLFVYCFTVMVVESALYYTGNTHIIISVLDWLGGSWYVASIRQVWSDGYTSIGTIYRPIGGFIDLSLSGLFIATTLYIYGRKYLGGFILILTMTLQSIIAYSIVFFSKRNILAAIIFLFILLYLMIISGHLNLDNNSSMINVYLKTFEYDFSTCLILGCSSNYLTLYHEGFYYSVNDNGPLKMLYFYGIPWLILYFYIVFKNSNNKLIPAIYFLTILHDPAGYGIMGTTLLAITVNYWNRVVNKPLVTSKKVIE